MANHPAIPEYINPRDFQTVCIIIPKEKIHKGRVFNVTSNEKALLRRNGTVIEQFSGRGKEVLPNTEVIVASLREYTLSIAFGAKSKYVTSPPDIEYPTITTITGEVIQSALVNITFAVDRDDKHNLHRLLEIPTQQTNKVTVKDIARSLSNNVNISGKIYVAGYSNNDNHKSIRYDTNRLEQIKRDIGSSVKELLASWGILLRSVSLHIYSTSMDEELLVREEDRQEQERILLELKQELDRVRADNAKKSADYEACKASMQREINELYTNKDEKLAKIDADKKIIRAEMGIEQLDALKRKIQLQKTLTEAEYAEKIAEIQARLGKIEIKPPLDPVINTGVTHIPTSVDQEIRKLTEQIRLNPNDVGAYKSRGDAYCEMGNYPTAILDYNEAITRYLKYTAAYKARGDAYYQLGQYSDAINDYNKAKELDPSIQLHSYANITVYVGSDDNYLYALDAATSVLKWRYKTGRGIRSSPAVYNGTVYVGSTDNYLYALDADIGALTWYYKIGNEIWSSPAVYNDTVYLGSNDYYLYALDADTGTLKWRYKTGSSISSSPAVYNGTVCVGSDDNYLYALDTATGTLKWRYKTGNYVRASPTVYNGTVYVGSDDNYLYALNAATGTLKWRYKTGDSIWSSSAVYNGTVYVGSWDRYLYALDADTGTLKWRYETSSIFDSSPAVYNGTVYVGSFDSSLYALDAYTGKRQWSYDTRSILVSSPAVYNGTVYIGSSTNYLYALDAYTGALKWRYETGGDVVSSPVVAEFE